MLDSGAYSAFKQDGVLNLTTYIKFLKWIIAKYPQADFEYVALDVIGDGEASYENWRRMRDAGLTPVPVYHVNSDEKWLEAYLKECDYIGIGAISDLTNSKRVLSLDRIWEKYLIDDDRMPKIKIHGMGLAGFEILGRYPWYSVDTTSWILTAGFGAIWIPRFRGGKWCYGKNPVKLFVTERSSPQNAPVRISATTKHQLTSSKSSWHYKSFTLEEQSAVVRYLSHIGESLEEQQACYRARARVNVWYYARFVEALGPYPRRFECTLARTLWED